MISFVILTIGSKPEKLARCIRSIKSNFNSNELYEIILVGNGIPPIELGGVRIIEDLEKKEFLGARKNIGTENSYGDILVHCDDDIIFPSNWFHNFNMFNEEWEIMGNKVLLPDGGRYWDRSIYLPKHHMVDYDFYSDDVTFYQSGAFSICKKSLLDKIRWSDDIPFYAMSKGFEYNEDVEFSIRLKSAGIKISFDKNNAVWHDDDSYLSNGFTCNKRQNQDDLKTKCLKFIIDSNI